jgi:hypothetical protein
VAPGPIDTDMNPVEGDFALLLHPPWSSAIHYMVYQFKCAKADLSGPSASV